MSIEGGLRQERHEKAEPFGALVVLGHQPRLSEDHEKIELSVDGKMRLLAAGELYQKGMVRKIIVSGGFTRGADMPSQAQLMKEFLHERFDIPEDDIIEENASTDTFENIENIKSLLGHDHINGRIAVLSNEYHLARVAQLLRKASVEAETIDAESLLAERSKHHKKFVDRYVHTPRMTIEKGKEIILRTMLVFNLRPKDVSSKLLNS